MKKRFTYTLLASVLAIGCAKPAPQPQPPTRIASSNSCADNIPASAMHLATAYLTVIPIDSAPSQLANSADLLAQDVATWVRKLVTGRTDTLASVDAQLHWTSLSAALPLTIYRNKAATRTTDTTSVWEVQMTPILHAKHPRAAEGRQLLSQAFDSVRAKSEPFFAWPNYPPMDSLRFALTFGWDGSDNESITPVRNPRPRFGLFQVSVPRGKMPLIVKIADVKYPSKAKRLGFQATVYLQFVIDSTGRAIPSTMKDIWPARAPKLEGEQAELYGSFVEEAKRSAAASQFMPAQLGGCPVRILVQQPYEFSLSK